MGKKVMAIGDMHLPCTDLKALDKIYNAIRHHKPDMIIQLGDLADFFSFSKFPRTYNWKTPEEELYEFRELAVSFWEVVARLSPKGCKLVQITGNHSLRGPKRVLERIPEMESLLVSSMKDLFKFKGVKTVWDDLYRFQNVLYVHGFKSKLGDHMRYYGENVVCGHTHRGGVVFEKWHGKQLFELNGGYLGDEKQIPLKYAQGKVTKWTKGYGLIDEHGPRFIPL